MPGGILVQAVLLIIAVYFRRRIGVAVSGLFFLGTAVAHGSDVPAAGFIGPLGEQAWLCWGVGRG